MKCMNVAVLSLNGERRKREEKDKERKIKRDLIEKRRKKRDRESSAQI